MKELLSQALSTIADGLSDMDGGEQFGTAVAIVVLTAIVIIITVAEPLAGLAIIGGISAIAFLILIAFPWIKSFR